MKKTISILFAVLISASMFAQGLATELGGLSGVSKVQRLENSVFPEKYLLSMTQLVDPSDASKGSFEQRVIVCHRGIDRPTVLVTEGYWADYALSPAYQEELSRLFNTNIVVVEYRYFGQSTPEPCDWDYLTVANSLVDLHNVREALGQIYQGKWISTGISKGGQTTMFYRSYYPDDVDISVPYVAPLNKALEDGRHEPFLAKQVGTAEERAKIEAFQTEILSRRESLVPLFKQHCDDKGYVFRVPVEEIFDLSVMEYSFTMWQWGYPVDSIPALDSDDATIMKYWLGMCEPDYFAVQSPYYSFNVQAARELGYYGYGIAPFKKLMSVKTMKDYMHRVMLDEAEASIKFDKTLYKHVVKFLKKEDPKMVYIYGGVDPWGCSGVCTWLDTSKKQNLKYYVKERGSHATRINSFDEPTRNEIIATIQKWLDE